MRGNFPEPDFEISVQQMLGASGVRDSFLTISSLFLKPVLVWWILRWVRDKTCRCPDSTMRRSLSIRHKSNTLPSMGDLEQSQVQPELDLPQYTVGSSIFCIYVSLLSDCLKDDLLMVPLKIHFTFTLNYLVCKNGSSYAVYILMTYWSLMMLFSTCHKWTVRSFSNLFVIFQLGGGVFNDFFSYWFQILVP